ncbi:copper chaperone for superoxide dismutase, chloroplastic/cytosolic-like isoform X2 [Punica granatum]|uniref:Superoxide dismutase copper chaperone n=1 Tax=Punica granatum TaxID=22663 RepID=A0A6P8D622_PUNGR|nr:copper chaperone for superoxide dismutase, chloroplastic/cytosolic-like isoform X2 [Punica granatum]
MAFLRTPTAIKTALPSKAPKLCSLSSLQLLSTSHLGPDNKKSLASPPPSALHMDAPAPDHRTTSQNGALLPELLTEFMVDMKCEGCVNAVKGKLQTVDGVKDVEVDLSNQVVRILGSAPVKMLTEALEQTGRKARLIGQGVPEDFLISAAVAEFKGPEIFGVVRFAQVNMDLSRVEASFSGLSSGKHGWSINEFGDLTRGAASTRKIFNPPIKGVDEPLGDLGTLEADEKGEAFSSGVKAKLRVTDLIGRSVVVYGTEDKSDSGIMAAVIARSAGVGENYKKLCTCDGTTIWESSNQDFVASKV